MKRLTWWQRKAVVWSHPLVLIIPVCATGLAIIAYSLARYGFGNAILHRQLLIGLCVGLVCALFEKWLTRRYLRYYVEFYLGLRSSEIGIALLQSVVGVLSVQALMIVPKLWGGKWTWAVSGAWLFAWLLIYPEMKALHEGIKAKLAEMENNDE